MGADIYVVEGVFVEEVLVIGMVVGVVVEGVEGVSVVERVVDPLAVIVEPVAVAKGTSAVTVMTVVNVEVDVEVVVNVEVKLDGGLGERAVVVVPELPTPPGP